MMASDVEPPKQNIEDEIYQISPNNRRTLSSIPASGQTVQPRVSSEMLDHMER